MLQKAFKEFGYIEYSRVILDPKTMASKGYGYVEFDTAGAAVKAVRVMNKAKFNR